MLLRCEIGACNLFIYVPNRKIIALGVILHPTNQPHATFFCERRGGDDEAASGFLARLLIPKGIITERSSRKISVRVDTYELAEVKFFVNA